MESFHLHIGDYKIKEVSKLIKNKKVIVLSKSTLNKENIDKNIKFISMYDFISPKTIKEKAKYFHQEINDLTKLVINRFNLIEILLSEYRYRGIPFSKKEAEKKIISAIYPSLCSVYHIVTIKQIILKRVSQTYKVDSFSKFIVDKSNSFFTYDDADLHKRMQFSDMWHDLIFSDLASIYFPDAKEIIFKFEKNSVISKKYFFSRKIQILKMRIFFKIKSIFFLFYKNINQSEYLFINTCFSKNYLEKCCKDLGNKMIKVPGILLTEFKVNKYLLDLQSIKNDIEIKDLKCVERIIIKNLPLSATSFFKSYLRISRVYKNLNYNKVVSSGGLGLLTSLRYHLVLFLSKKNNLFIVQHGAGLGIIYPLFYHIEKVYGDYYLNWGFNEKNSIAKKEFSIECTRPLKISKRNNLDGKVYIFLSAYPSQPTRLNSELNYNSVSLKEIPLFLKALLDQNINSDNVVLRPYPAKSHYTSNEFCNALNYLSNYLKLKFPFIAQEIDRSGESIQESASLVIYTYFGGASFFQRLNANLPLLIFDIFKGEWISNEFESIYLLMKSAEIIFDDPVLLARKVASIKDDIDGFWKSKDVRIALNEFNKKYSSQNNINNVLKRI